VCCLLPYISFENHIYILALEIAGPENNTVIQHCASCIGTLSFPALTCAVGRELVASFGLRAVEGLSLEWISKNLYFTDNTGFIGVIRLRSRHFQDVRRLITDLGNPRAIVANPLVGYALYMLLTVAFQKLPA